MRIIALTILGLAVLFQSNAQSEYCGAGTIWDAESQTCIAAENAELLDSDLDGIIGVEDLLNLLSHFGDEDMDFDGIYDSVDDCVGAYDECGLCNGPGPQILGIDTIIVYYDSLYAEAIDEWWVFEVDADTLLTYLCENPGCMDPTADNYDPYAIEEDGSCQYPNAGPACDYASTAYFDGYYYDLVGIGNQCWFAENLRTTIYANGDSIPGNLNGITWHETSEPAQAIYGEGTSAVHMGNENAAENLIRYGRLYNYFAVHDSRNICPSGWHVSTDSDWMEMEISLGMDPADAELFGWDRGTNEALLVKAESGGDPDWGPTTCNGAEGGGNNLSGFSALPGGLREEYGAFSWEGKSSSFWSSDNSTMTRSLFCIQEQIGRFQDYVEPQSGFSVRCVKD